MQTIRMQRPRIAPMWKAGLRRGKPRNSTMLLLQQYPEYEARLRAAQPYSRMWRKPDLDPHYGDQAELHARGRLGPWPFTRGAVEDAAVRRTLLLPRPA